MSRMARDTLFSLVCTTRAYVNCGPAELCPAPFIYYWWPAQKRHFQRILFCRVDWPTATKNSRRLCFYALISATLKSTSASSITRLAFGCLHLTPRAIIFNYQSGLQAASIQPTRAPAGLHYTLSLEVC